MTDREPGARERVRTDGYGPIRTYVIVHPERFARLDDALESAHVPETVDAYVARVARHSVVGALCGLLVGLLAAALAPLPVLARLACVPLGLLLGGGGVAGGHLALLRRRIARRRRAIDGALPHATVFLYALVHGGTDLYEAFDRLADETEAYGPLAEEVRLAVRDTERFNADLFDALTATRERTPSDDFTVLLDELVGVLETGGDVEAFLADAVTDQRERAEHRQERVLEDLETTAEAYVAVALAGPAFLFVVLLVASFTAPGLVGALAALTYLLLPLLLVAFSLVFKRLLARARRHGADPVAAVDVGATERDPAAIDDGPIDDYLAGRERATWRERLAAPLAAARDAPRLLFLASVPLALLALLALAALGVVPLSVSGLAATPIRATTGLAVVPFLVAVTPIAFLYILERRRERDLRGRFPDALRVVADAASNSVPLADAVGLVAERTTGTLADELDRVRRDVAWTADFPRALRTFADRLGVPAVTRAIGLTVVAVRTTDDPGPVLEAVADDLGQRHEREVDRRRTLGVYAGIVVIGVLVYVGMLLAFDLVFLPAVANAAGASASLPAAGIAGIHVGQIDTGTYRTLFYHSALVQAAGNGLVVGALVGGRLRDGVAYAAPLVAVVACVFLGASAL
ncbi:type II secretion system F family protein [Halarchaeum sp. CBA1220]|uniref:type II secretion system F family protein n=1 Tax=Halarchaeum sp. CBA1220 TaxID=1853682 RepID=UPI000F3A7EFE|nr:type II secretion system F family protein [Halarchaeum sp. CBA1220]QLC33677.1 type II secretion system F family protein [Halarchaeum sp. CBA1220]